MQPIYGPFACPREYRSRRVTHCGPTDAFIHPESRVVSELRIRNARQPEMGLRFRGDAFHAPARLEGQPILRPPLLDRRAHPS